MGEASGIKKNKVRPGIQSEENAIFDKVVSSEEMSLEPFECLEEKHSRRREVHLQRPRDGHTRSVKSPKSGEASVARAVIKRQRGDRGGLAGQGRREGFHLCLVRSHWRVLCTRHALTRVSVYKADGRARCRGVKREVREDGGSEEGALGGDGKVHLN